MLLRQHVRLIARRELPLRAALVLLRERVGLPARRALFGHPLQDEVAQILLRRLAFDGRRRGGFPGRSELERDDASLELG